MKKFIVVAVLALLSLMLSAQTIANLPGTTSVSTSDLVVVDQVNPSSPTGYTTRKGAVSQLVAPTSSSIVPTASFNCVGNGVADDTLCMQSALNAAVNAGVPLLIGLNNTKYLITSTLTSSGVVDIEGFAPVGNDGIGNAQTCLNGLTVGTHQITLFNLTGPKVMIHNLCMQMGTPGVLTGGSGAAILLGGSDQSHDDISGNTIFWPYDGIQVGGAGGLVRASNISRNIIRSPARYGIAIGMGTTDGQTAGITMIDNQIGCDARATGTGLAIFDGAVVVDGTNEGPNNCVIGTAIIPGSLQNINGQFRGVMGDANTTHDLLIAPTETGGVLFGGTVNFLDFTQVWAASVTNETSVLVRCPANTICSEITFNGLTAHGGAGQTLPIVDIERGAGGPFNLTLANSTICSFGGAGGGEIGLKLNLIPAGTNARWLINSNRIGQGCGTAGTSATPIGIAITTAGSGNGRITITGNDLSASATPISYTPGDETMLIVNNMGVDDQCPSVTSATTISLPNAATCVHLTGVSTITGITNSNWITRTVRVIADSGLSLNIGGITQGFCGSSVTLGAAQQSILTWDNENACWLHTP